MSDLQEVIDQIKERNKAARHHNRMPQIKSGDRDIYEKLLDSQADVPRLVGIVEEVMKRLKEPEDWHVYDTRDIGEAYSADTVMDFIRGLEDAIAARLKEKP